MRTRPVLLACALACFVWVRAAPARHPHVHLSGPVSASPGAATPGAADPVSADRDAAATPPSSAIGGADTSGPVVGDAAKVLTGVHATEHFRIRYRPGSVAGASVDRLATLLEGEYGRILDRLGLRGRVDESSPFFLCLYDSLAEMEAVTGVAGSGGFSAVRESHVPYDNDQTRLHELVHIVVAAAAPRGTEPRNFFFVEGLANAVLECVHGVPVHCVAAFERRRGSLPSLATLAGADDFYAYLRENPGFNGYDVGGSFMLYLLETYGAERTMNFHLGMPAQEALGAGLDDLEQGWHALLDGVELRPELVTLLKRRRGDRARFTHLLPPQALLPAEVQGTQEQWIQLDLAPRDEIGAWRSEDGRVIGDNPDGAKWSICEAQGGDGENGRWTDCVIHATVHAGRCWGVQIRLGDECQAMLLGQGAFIYHKDRHGVAFSSADGLSEGETVDLVLCVDRGRLMMYVNGERILDAEAPTGSGPVGIGVVGGYAEFSDVRVRPLP